jgi:hypothetical protein
MGKTTGTGFEPRPPRDANQCAVVPHGVVVTPLDGSYELTKGGCWKAEPEQGARTVISLGDDRNWRYEGDYGGCDVCGSGVVADIGNGLIGVGGELSFELEVWGEELGGELDSQPASVQAPGLLKYWAARGWQDGSPPSWTPLPAGVYNFTTTVPAGLTAAEIVVRAQLGECDDALSPPEVCPYNDRPWELRNLGCNDPVCTTAKIELRTLDAAYPAGAEAWLDDVTMTPIIEGGALVGWEAPLVGYKTNLYALITTAYGAPWGDGNRYTVKAYIYSQAGDVMQEIVHTSEILAEDALNDTPGYIGGADGECDLVVGGQH